MLSFSSEGLPQLSVSSVVLPQLCFSSVGLPQLSFSIVWIAAALFQQCRNAAALFQQCRICAAQFQYSCRSVVLVVQDCHSSGLVQCRIAAALFQQFRIAAATYVHLSQIGKLLRSPRINSKESISLAYVAWRAGTKLYSYQFPASQMTLHKEMKRKDMKLLQHFVCR